MENQIDQQPHFCASCAQQYQPTDAFCNGCGYPFQGTEQEQRNHISYRSAREIDLDELNKKADRACKSLYWIAAILTLSFCIEFFRLQADEDPTFIFFLSVILVGSFLALGVWSKTKPVAAMITGLSLFVILQLLIIIGEPAAIFSGIIFKVIVIVFLVKGIIAVLEADKLKKELNIK